MVAAGWYWTGGGVHVLGASARHTHAHVRCAVDAETASDMFDQDRSAMFLNDSKHIFSRRRFRRTRFHMAEIMSSRFVAALALLQAGNTASLTLSSTFRPRPHFQGPCRHGIVTASDDGRHKASGGSLPPELAPITMGVFSQMLGEGIAMSSLPVRPARLEPLRMSTILTMTRFAAALPHAAGC